MSKLDTTLLTQGKKVTKKPLITRKLLRLFTEENKIEICISKDLKVRVVERVVAEKEN